MTLHNWPRPLPLTSGTSSTGLSQAHPSLGMLMSSNISCALASAPMHLLSAMPGIFSSQLFCVVCIFSSNKSSVNCQLLIQPPPTTSVNIAANPPPRLVPFPCFVFLRHTYHLLVFLCLRISLLPCLSPPSECKPQESRTFSALFTAVLLMPTTIHA